MSVNREITIKLLSNKDKFSDLFIEFVTDFWCTKNNFQISSLEKEDIDNFDFVDFPNFDILKPILDYREENGYTNCLSFWVEKLDEIILIHSNRISKDDTIDSYFYKLSFTPGIGKRIKNAERYTDFGFYLNQIIPQLIKLDCCISEIKCHDYDF